MKIIKSIILTLTSILITTSTTFAAEVPRESTPIYTTNGQIIAVERLVGNVFDKVQNGMGYSDARAESNYIIFNAWLNGQTDGFAFGELVNVASNAIWQY